MAPLQVYLIKICIFGGRNGALSKCTHPNTYKDSKKQNKVFTLKSKPAWIWRLISLAFWKSKVLEVCFSYCSSQIFRVSTDAAGMTSWLLCRMEENSNKKSSSYLSAKLLAYTTKLRVKIRGKRGGGASMDQPCTGHITR